MHYHRVHSGKCPGRGRKKQADPAANHGVNGSSSVIDPAGAAKPERKPRKTREAPAVNCTEVQINYCPQCGCHLLAVAEGMAIAARLKVMKDER